MKHATHLLTCAACLLISSFAFAASGKVYKWTDSKGQTHFGEQPPLNIPKEVIKTAPERTDPAANTATTAAKPADAKSSSTQSAPASDKKNGYLIDKDRCEAARKNAASLKTYTHIKVKEENGEYRYLSPEEQQKKLDDTNKVIDESCE